MTNHEIHLDLLLDKQVIDPSGKAVGRIEEVIAEKQADEWVITEYLIGTAAVLERLSAWTIGLAILSLFGARKLYAGYRVAWDKLDLTDLEHPRLNCPLEELPKISQPQSQDSFEQYQ